MNRRTNQTGKAGNSGKSRSATTETAVPPTMLAIAPKRRTTRGMKAPQSSTAMGGIAARAPFTTELMPRRSRFTASKGPTRL